MNGAVGVRTQFLSWLSKNNKNTNNNLNKIKPKVFIFDNDDQGKEKYGSIEKALENKDNTGKITLFKCIDIQEKKIKDNPIFEGYEITKTINNIQEKAFLLKYSDKLKKVSDDFDEIEDFIDNKEIKGIFIKHKGNKKTIENNLSQNHLTII